VGRARVAAQLVGVDRRGSPAKANHQQQDGAKDVEVDKRVERHATKAARRVVAEAVGDEGMRELVIGKGQQGRQRKGNERAERLRSRVEALVTPD
jgi:hypothetical protein